MKPKILFSIPSQSHVEIALDEVEGMKHLGYTCGKFSYAARTGYDSRLAKLYIIIRNAFSLIRKSDRFRPDIIYFNSRLEVIAGIRDAITIFLFKCFHRREVKFVIKSHGSDLEVVEDPRYFMRSIIMPYLRKNISSWLLLSDEEKRELCKMNYFDSGKLWVTKNIVRVNQFKPDVFFKEKYRIPANHITLLFSGRIITEKGIFEVIKAFAALRLNHEATLIVAGSGSAMEEVKRLCCQLKVQDNIRFIGFVPEKEVIPFYSNCDILVFPTYFPEGFPMALFNSVAAGMAIVTTPMRAAVDYLRQDENCLWVEPRNAASVAEALETLALNTKTMDDMKRNNQLLAPEFNQSKVCSELSDILYKVHYVSKLRQSSVNDE